MKELIFNENSEGRHIFLIFFSDETNKMERMTTILILTPLPLEFDAVVRHLADRKSIVYEAATYETGTFTGNKHPYQVVLCQPGMKNVDMALATEIAIRHFKPQIALLIGIAGGVKDVRIGDVLIATKAYSYEAGKEDGDGFKARPSAESFSADLLAFALQLSRKQDWKNRTIDQAPEARIFIGPIAAGDKVVADISNPTYQRIKLHFNDTLALEMEAVGFAAALQKYRHIHALAIRGISDLCEGKSETDKQNWQPVAADRAAAVGFELLYQLDISTFISPPMDSKTLATELYNLLLPSADAVKAMETDFAQAGPETRNIWQQIKPLLADELAELKQAPADTDAQGAVRTKLKRELDKNESMLQELTTLLEKAKALTGGGVNIVNSKNVISGSTISVGGDFRLGDG
jgi:nucleoside phosphorylase